MNTPRTDAAFKGDLSVGVQPELANWQDAADFARTLERELAEAKHHTAEVLAACDVAALSDTEEAYARAECKRDSNFWSPAYESVRRRTRECIDLRKERDALRAEVERLKRQTTLLLDSHEKMREWGDKWREDAERLAGQLTPYVTAAVKHSLYSKEPMAALAAHDALMKGDNAKAP